MPFLGKKIVPDIWAKMLSASQIAGFLNQLYLQRKSMKYPDLLVCQYKFTEIKC